MIDSRTNKVILSPEDAATLRQWRRAVCAFYAGVVFVLVAVWGAHQIGAPGGEAQVAGVPGHAPVADAGLGEPATRRQ